MSSTQTCETLSQFGKIVSYCDDLVTHQVQKYGNHSRPEFAFATSVLDFDMNVFDLGAHIGTFSLVAVRKITKSQKLLAVEGNPKTFALLRQNLDRCHGTEANCVCAFVGAVEGLHYQEIEGNTGAGHLVVGGGGDDVILSKSIDQLASDYFVPDYIKIDVEGMEYTCLAESAVVREHLPIIYMEVNRRMLSEHGHAPLDLHRLLRRLGYHFFVNVGDRNGKHDVFKVAKLDALTGYRAFFDVLCIPADSDQLKPLMRASGPSLVE